MKGPLYVEALALKGCHPVAVRLYLNALLKLADFTTGRVSGPRRLMYSALVTAVGPVAHRGQFQRPLQHSEVGALLDQLTMHGVIQSYGTADELDLLMVHRAPRVAA